MSIKLSQPEPCWEIVCDRCDEHDELGDGGHAHYASEADAKDAATGHDWTVTHGVALCLDCSDQADDEVACPVCGVPAGKRCIIRPDDYGYMHDERRDALALSLKEAPDA